MSEVNRVPLISFSSSRVNEKECKTIGRTIRISVSLPQSNEDTYPEFNYKEELAAAKRKDKPKQEKNTNTNGLVSFVEDDDEDVRRIAQEMEAKYGGVAPKKKRKGRKDDYADIGMGYDESDSFIDNTDGYDEMVPQNVTTLLGGFYINCGALEFKTDDEVSSNPSSNESDGEEIGQKPRKLKRVLEFSDDSEGENETDKANHTEKKQKLDQNGVTKIVKKKFMAQEKYKSKKKRPEDRLKSPTVKELLKEKREDINISPTYPSKKEETKDMDPEIDKKNLFDNVTDTIEAVVKGKPENKMEISLEDKLARLEGNSDIKKVETSSDGDSRDAVPNGTVDIVKLPANLPAEIVQTIDKIKEIASNRTEGKVKFFSGPVSDLLLSLERNCRCLGKQSRTKVYEHLAPFVRCRKETLIKRAKNLVLEDDKRQIGSLLTKLKSSIDSIMPSLLESYETECQKILQKKSKENLESEETKQIRMPKRRFAWTENMKKLLKKIVAIRRKCYVLDGLSKEAAENQMDIFLKNEVQVLFPDGWMSMNALRKFCNNAYDVKKVATPEKPPKPPVPDQNSTGLNLSSLNKDLQIIPTNSALSITPIPTTTIEEKSEITVIKDDLSSKKDIAKSSSITITPAETQVLNLETTITPSPVVVEENNIVPQVTVEKASSKSEVKHCPPSNRTESDPIKAKTKYIEDIEMFLQPREIINKAKIRADSEKWKGGQKEEAPTMSRTTFNKMFSEFTSNFNKASSKPPSQNKITDHSIKKLSGHSSYNSLGYSNPKMSTEGDAIQKVMEDLKALQKLSSPNKLAEAPSSSPVSVIAYNKSFNPKHAPSTHSSSLSQPAMSISPFRSDYKADFGPGFQEVFQRQLQNEFNLMKSSSTDPPTSKSHNSSDKYSHSSIAQFTNEKYYQSPNSGFPMQDSSKIKIGLPTTQAANHKPKAPQK